METTEVLKITAFDKIRENVELIKDDLLSIKVTDHDSAESANDSIKNAKKKIKDLGETRKALTKPLDDEKKKIMGAEKEIVAIITEGVNHATKELIDHNKRIEAELEKTKRELEAKQEAGNDHKAKIDSTFDIAYQDIIKCTTTKEIFTKYIAEGGVLSKMKAEGIDTSELESNIRTLGKAKKENMDKPEPVLLTILGKIKDELTIETKDEIIAKQELAVAETEYKQVGAKKTIKYKVVSMKNVPDKFKETILNDKVIKEHMKEYKEQMNFVESQPIEGIEFYYETGLSGR